MASNNYCSGGPSGEYSHYEDIGQAIRCDKGYISLKINYLQSQQNKDYLYIFAGINTLETWLYRGSGSVTNVNVCSASMGQTALYILFTSDGSTTDSGYEIAWSCGTKDSKLQMWYVPCAAGTYSNAIGASSSATCVPCDPQTYSLSGYSSCSVCPAGYYSPTNALCIACPQDSYSVVAASPSCIPCPAGSFTNGTGSTSCIACSSGGYCASQIDPQTIFDR